MEQNTKAPEEPAADHRWELVTARDIMRTDVVVLSYATPLSEVERTFSESSISGAPVTNEAGHIVGIVTLKDLVERYAEDPDSHPRRRPGYYETWDDEMHAEDMRGFRVPAEAEDTVGDVMTAQVHAVDVSAGLREIANAMTSHRIHRVLVQEDGKYVGLISTLEVLDVLSA